MRGIDISENFVDIHLLKKTPAKSRCFTSSNENATYAFEVNEDCIIITAAPFQNFENYEVKILHEVTAYNKEFETYAILIIDKPLSPEFKTKPSDEDLLILEKDITSLNEALQFFSNFLQPHGERWLTSLNNAADGLIPSLIPTMPLDQICSTIHETVATQWNILLCTHSLKRQRDARFQGLLSSAIEIYIVNRLHEQIFPLLCAVFVEEDKKIYSRTREFCELGVTVDQFGAPEDFAVPLPAAVVELASIDRLTSPVDKLTCLRTTMDLIMAEIKGAIVDAHCVLPTGNEPWSPPIRPTSDDLIPLLMGVLVQAKPLHLASNLFYMENFQWTLEPNNALSHSLVTFKTAVQTLLGISINELPPKSRKILQELSLEDLIKVTGVVDGRFNRGGERKDVPLEERGAFSPLDRQLEHLTNMIEASTRELDKEEFKTTERLPSPSSATASLIAAIHSNLGTCLSKQEGI